MIRSGMIFWTLYLNPIQFGQVDRSACFGKPLVLETASKCAKLPKSFAKMTRNCLENSIFVTRNFYDSIRHDFFYVILQSRTIWTDRSIYMPEKPNPPQIALFWGGEVYNLVTDLGAVWLTYFDYGQNTSMPVLSNFKIWSFEFSRLVRMGNMRVQEVKVLLNASSFVTFPLAFHLPLQKPPLLKSAKYSVIFAYSGGQMTAGGTARGKNFFLS